MDSLNKRSHFRRDSDDVGAGGAGQGVGGVSVCSLACASVSNVLNFKFELFQFECVRLAASRFCSVHTHTHTHTNAHAHTHTRTQTPAQHTHTYKHTHPHTDLACVDDAFKLEVGQTAVADDVVGKQQLVSNLVCVCVCVW